MNRLDAPPMHALGDSPPSSRSGRSIGAILIDSGHLTPVDADSIARFQRQNGSRFGDAAIELGLVSQDDIRVALASQFDFPCLPGNDTSLDRKLVAAYRPDAPIVEQLRRLRSQLMLRWFEATPEPKALAIVGPGRQEGRSFIAANLAAVFSQLGERTLLIDGNLRSPSLHRLFKINPGPGLSGVLSGRAGSEAIVRVPALRSLSVLPAGALPPNPQELLGRTAFSELLQAACRSHSVVLIDTPAACDYADALTVAARAGGALLVARKGDSSLPKFAAVARDLSTACTVVGSILNDIRR